MRACTCSSPRDPAGRRDGDIPVVSTTDEFMPLFAPLGEGRPRWTGLRGDGLIGPAPEGRPLRTGPRPCLWGGHRAGDITHGSGHSHDGPNEVGRAGDITHVNHTPFTLWGLGRSGVNPSPSHRPLTRLTRACACAAAYMLYCAANNLRQLTW